MIIRYRRWFWYGFASGIACVVLLVVVAQAILSYLEMR